MTGIIPIRNRLAYPAGIAPGFDPTHVAARKVRLSTVPIRANHVDLLTGKPGTVTGTITAKTDRIIGPAVDCVVASTNKIVFSGFPAVADAEQTIAGIARVNAANGEYLLSTSGSSDQGVNVSISNNYGFTKAGVVSIYSTFTQVANESYFFLVSNKDTVACHFLLKNLRTGQVLTETLSSAGSSGTSPGTYSVASHGAFSASSECVAAVMYSASYMTLSQMRVWAEDPWAFWYPNINDVGIQAFSSFRSRTPAFDTPRRVYPL